MLKIGLTGGIGSGKTIVADFFAHLGIPVIDADLIAHSITSDHSEASNAIRRAFGDDFFTATSKLDRRKLREEVFKNPDKLQQLEAILHPRIRKEILRQLEALSYETHPYCIIAIPLIIESGMLDLVDRLIVVDVPEEIQIQRVIKRDNVDRAQVEHILSRQASRTDRLAAADFVIDNSQDLETTREQVQTIDNLLC